ncbi:MAG TPA: response regulator [Vicinamibacteria bacterium]|nr:response regulator [Vicinamibacteria bacterium]
MADLAAKFLLVEDDDETRALVESILGFEGHTVVSTADPTAALGLARTESPDLVLCDITMPLMDGYGVLKALQSDPATANIPVVFLSGHKDFSERVRAFRFGVIDYISKPFTRETLVRKVARILEGRSRRPGFALESAEPEAPAPTPAAPAPFRASPELASGVEPTDPPSLPGTAARLPTFDSFPEAFRNVLVVDDNSFFRRFLRDLLAGQGFTVHEAADGDEGLRVALDRRPWLILTDVRMPGTDGFEFCRNVRAHSLIRQTPLLFLSGWDEYKQRYHGLKLGADDFLSKETSVRELLIRIQLVMKRYAGLDEAKGAGIEGEIAMLGVPGALQVCHLSRLSGVLTAENGPRVATVRFRDGEVVGAECDGLEGEYGVFAFLGWERGLFRFRAGDPGPGDVVGGKFDALLLDGCRRLDEANREQHTADGEGAAT